MDEVGADFDLLYKQFLAVEDLIKNGAQANYKRAEPQLYDPALQLNMSQKKIS